jgi:hypothetical protein
MLFFIDESGTDEKVAPYVVRGGIAISEGNVWKLEQAVKSLERELFGTELSDVGLEIKGSRLLKRKTFRHAAQGPPIEPERRRVLACEFLKKGFMEKNGGIPPPHIKEEYTAYGQAALIFVEKLLGIAAIHGVKTFGSIVLRNCPQLCLQSFLRRDYMYLFERFYYYLETFSNTQHGILICDELEVQDSQMLINQIANYFLKSGEGQIRSNLIVPVPFFVRSHLTIAIQLADLVCYIANWSVRFHPMTEPIREELRQFGEKVIEMQFKARRLEKNSGETWTKYGYCYITDLSIHTDRLL